MNIEIRQIFYDDVSRALIKPPYIPLDNREGDASWYEFFPILQFLENHELDDNTLYGFFSPKFEGKTGHSYESVIAAIRQKPNNDAYLFSFAGDQLKFFFNPWEQGDVCHSGVTEATQQFLNQAGIRLNLPQFLTTRRNAVFCNYIVACKDYWLGWMDLAQKYRHYIDSSRTMHGLEMTRYRRQTVSLKVFVQERFPAIVIALQDLKSTFIENAPTHQQLSSLFVESEINRQYLDTCEALKEKMLTEGISRDLLGLYSQIRRRVEFRKPSMRRMT